MQWRCWQLNKICVTTVLWTHAVELHFQSTDKAPIVVRHCNGWCRPKNNCVRLQVCLCVGGWIGWWTHACRHARTHIHTHTHTHAHAHARPVCIALHGYNRELLYCFVRFKSPFGSLRWENLIMTLCDTSLLKGCQTSLVVDFSTGTRGTYTSKRVLLMRYSKG